MRKEMMAGLAVLVLGCSRLSYSEPVMSQPAPAQPMHRGVLLTGVIYRDIQIIGPVDYTERMKHSLDRVSQTPFWPFVHTHLTAIRFNPPSKVHVENGIFDSDDNKTTPTKNQSDPWIDSELVHEACHVSQYKTGRESWGYRAEKECIEWQNLYFLHLGNHTSLLNVEKLLQERYWEKENRWW